MSTSSIRSSDNRRALAIAALLLLGEAGTRAQCAMCRLSLASPEGQAFAGPLRAGIIVLLIAPLAVFAIVAFFAVRSRRRLGALRKWNPEPGHTRPAVSS